MTILCDSRKVTYFCASNVISFVLVAVLLPKRAKVMTNSLVNHSSVVRQVLNVLKLGVFGHLLTLVKFLMLMLITHKNPTLAVITVKMLSPTMTPKYSAAFAVTYITNSALVYLARSLVFCLASFHSRVGSVRSASLTMWAYKLN